MVCAVCYDQVPLFAGLDWRINPEADLPLPPLIIMIKILSVANRRDWGHCGHSCIIGYREISDNRFVVVRRIRPGNGVYV